MRRPLHGDAVSVARVLLDARPERRHWILARLFREAERAHSRIRQGQRPYPNWGDGSLMTAALRRRPVPEPSLADADYCRCLSMVYAALAMREG